MLYGEDRIDVAMYWNWSLGGARREKQQMAREPLISLLDPKPERRRYTGWSEEERQGIVRSIAVPPQRILRGGRQLPVQIMHFACHCDTSSAADGRHFLELGGSSPNLKVALDDLTGVLPREYPWDECGPLAFVNACAGAYWSHENPSSFPARYLGQLGYRAFVGPSIAIDDQAAADFASRFYQSLLQGRASVGSSLVNARNDFLTEALNPLGLAYICYGESELRIALSESRGDDLAQGGMDGGLETPATGRTSRPRRWSFLRRRDA
jgi:hypothetical protein